MLETITLEDAQARLSELIARLVPGREVLITQNDRPVARLIGQPEVSLEPRKPGSAIGKFIIHADDDEHLKDFREYMQ